MTPCRLQGESPTLVGTLLFPVRQQENKLRLPGLHNETSICCYLNWLRSGTDISAACPECLNKENDMYFLFPRQPRLRGSGTGALSPASLQQLWELQNEMSPNELLVTRSQPVQSTSLPTTYSKWVPEEHYQKLTRKVCQNAAKEENRRRWCFC